jgi:hypothetical protein
MTQQQNFQPQVRDTSSGPNLHTYIPLEDGAVVIGGITFLPETGVATAATIPVTVTGAPLPTGHPVPVSPYVIPPGGPAIQAFAAPPVQLTPQYYPYPCHYFPLSSLSLGYAAAPSPYPYYQQASVSVSLSFSSLPVPVWSCFELH